MSRSVVLLVPAAIVVGLASEATAYDIDEPARWFPDLAAGWALIGCGFVAWTRHGRAGAGGLLTLTGFAWFLGGFDDALVALHRGPLIHLLLCYPEARPSGAFERTAVGAAYVSAVVPAAWSSEPVAIVLSLLLVAAAAHVHLVAVGPGRRSHVTAFRAAAAIGLVLAGGAVARVVVPAPDADQPALVAYELALAAAAALLLLDLQRRPREQAAVADLVVDLGGTRAATLQGALAEALGDPTLEIGYRLEWADGYVDREGRPYALPAPDSERSLTYVDQDGRTIAVLVHDPAVLQDATLVAALRSVAGLAAANARLQGEVRAYVAELDASRRRLLNAGDAERRLLEQRLRDGAERRLAHLSTLLAGIDGPEVRQATGQLESILADLGELAQGLHPRALAEDGLAGALRALAAACPVPVELVLDARPQAEDVESAAYHDGAQQGLLALSYDLRLAERAAEPGSREGVLLASAVGETDAALADLRELAHGIYPAILTEAGLGPALETLADVSPLSLEIEAAPEVRVPAAVETAAYVVVADLVEAAERSEATRVRVRLEVDRDLLLVEVAYDGDAIGSVPQRLADRVGALGGNVELHGRDLRAAIPCA